MAGVIAYSGHRTLGGADPERRIATQMDELIERHDVVAGYGSLAAGADVLWAERLVARGAEVHMVLPFDADRFIATSVRPVGDAWVPRFRSLLGAATSVDVLATNPHGGDDVHAYAAAASRFQADTTARARKLGVVPRLLVVWDGEPSAGSAGTGADVERWQVSGHPVDIISLTRPPS